MTIEVRSLFVINFGYSVLKTESFNVLHHFKEHPNNKVSICHTDYASLCDHKLSCESFAHI